MQTSFRLTGVFSVTLMQNRIYRGVDYAGLQDGLYTFNTHKIALFWKKLFKTRVYIVWECICFSREKQWQ